MSGHNKWSTIKNKKAKTDAAKGKIFTKIGREIVIAVKTGGSADPALNSKLKDVIAKAKAANMPNDNITRSIKKATGEGANVQYEEIVYEGYSVGGVAVIVEVTTDNRNRAAAEIRHHFDKSGGALGASGCVAWMFDRKGVITVDAETVEDEDELMMAALDAGAEDVNNEDGEIEILTDPSDFSTVREALEEAGYTFTGAEISRIPQNTVALDSEGADKLNRLLDMLDDSDDVSNVYHNAELPDEE